VSRSAFERRGLTFESEAAACGQPLLFCSGSQTARRAASRFFPAYFRSVNFLGSTVSESPDHFALLGLERGFALDPAALEQAFVRAQSKVHPDRFASASAAEKRVAMQWSAAVNGAHQALKSPLRRAAYLCELHGAPIEAETQTAMPSDFLQQQMLWREALDDAGDEGAVRQVIEQVAHAHAALISDLARLLDQEHDYAGAAKQVRQLLFLDKMQRDFAQRAGADDRADELTS